MATMLEQLWMYNSSEAGHERFYPPFSDIERDLLTLLPFADFAWSARCFDDSTLAQQRQVVYEVMRALLTGEGWVDHPVMLMWYDYENILLAYQQALCHEASTVRGQRDDWWDMTRLLFLEYFPDPTSKTFIVPVWMGDPDFHISHQSKLLTQNEAHYRPWFPGIRNDHIIKWPVL